MMELIEKDIICSTCPDHVNTFVSDGNSVPDDGVTEEDSIDYTSDKHR